MMGRSWNKARKIGIALALIVVFAILLLNAFAEEELTKISELEKEDLSDEDNEALREYYGQVFGIIGENSRFNNIATKENIAIINVTIDGRDRRIITKLATGVVLPKIADKLVAALLQADNVTVFDYLRILGKTIFSKATSFGERNFYGIESSEAKYVDEGFSRLVNGKANISVNPVLRELISRYNVYLSAEGLTKGIYVSEKSSSYFVVRSVNENSNIGFSWMLSGIKKESDGKLKSEIGKELGIDITATINPENGTTTVRIDGFDKILELLDKHNNQIINNNTINNNSNYQNGTINQNDITNNETNSNSNDGQGIQVITGNVIDEFGLENDLGGILSETPQTLPEIGNPNININNNPINDNTDNNDDQNNNLDNNQNNGNVGTGQDANDSASGPDAVVANNEIDDIENSALNETDNSVLEFVLFSADESFIVSQISEVTGLHADDVRKLVTFVYSDPIGFEDEIVEQATGKIDGIEKINGSVIIRLG